MRDGMKKAGFIGLGAVLGVLLSLNLSVFAQRESRLPIPYEDLQLLSAVFGKIKSDYVEPVSDDKLIKEAINGMVHGLDPHSDFLDADAFKELQVATQGKFGGLGIEVGVEDGVVRVISPIEDTPAFRAGIKAGDLIVKIDDVVTRGMPLSKAVEKMRGRPGTSITLTVVRKDAEAPLNFTLTREEINVKSVRYKTIEPGYGYIRIRQFQDRTGEDLAVALRDMYKKEGDLKGLVLDVRSDPGGLLNQAVAVSAAFLPKDALVVYTDGRTPDAQDAPHREPRELRSPRRRLPARPACGGQEGAAGRAGRRRHRVGLRNRRRRAAGSQAGDGDGRADVRQGLGADDPADRQQRRASSSPPRATTRRRDARSRRRASSPTSPSTTAANRRTASARRISSATWRRTRSPPPTRTTSARRRSPQPGRRRRTARRPIRRFRVSISAATTISS